MTEPHEGGLMARIWKRTRELQDMGKSVHAAHVLACVEELLRLEAALLEEQIKRGETPRE